MLKLGKRHIEIATKWLPSASLFGITAGCLGCYVTDWKLVLEHVPYYGGKFKTDDQ